MNPRSWLLSLLLAVAVTATADLPCERAGRNHPPVANDDYFTWPPRAEAAGGVDVLANDSDADLDILTVRTVSAGTGGTPRIINGGKAVAFDAAPNAGSATFSYTVGDGTETRTADVALGGAGKQVDFSATCKGIKCSFDAQPLDRNGIRSFTWNFGNGKGDVVWTGFHYYHEFAESFGFQLPEGQTRQYVVRLTVDYESGDRGTRERTITLVGEKWTFAYSMFRYGRNLQITISQTSFPLNVWNGAVDASMRPVNPPNGTRWFTYILSPITDNLWGPRAFTYRHFSDGYPTYAGVTFSASGAQEVWLYVKEETFSNGEWVFANAYDVAKITLDVAEKAPTARFDFTESADGRTFTFDPKRSFDDLPITPGHYEFLWEFGDGTHAYSEIVPSGEAYVGKAVTHTYTTPGTYPVYLTLTDFRALGETGSASQLVSVANEDPKASFLFTCAGLTCSFDGRASSDADDGIDGWTWTFGDGSTGNGSTASRTFAAAGCYQAELTVRDIAGQTATTRKTVSVSAAPLAPAGKIVVDAHALPGVTKSNLNGILEPDEIVMFEPVRAVSLNDTTVAGTFAGFDGSSTAATYRIVDATATHAVTQVGTQRLTECWKTGDCYAGSVTAATRPAQHWDAFVHENGPLGYQGFIAHIGKTFNDVPVTHFAYPYIEALAHFGVTSGCAPGAFCPSTPMDRLGWGVLLMFARAGGPYTAPACTSDPFTDVPCSHWAGPYINHMKQLGITGGCGGGQYCGANTVTRAEAMVMLVRALGVTPRACVPTFSDVPCSATQKHWAADFIQEGYARGITAGCAPGRFCPDDAIARDQAAVFLSRAFDLTVAYPQCAAGTEVSQ